MIDLITLNMNLESARNSLADFKDRLSGAEAAKSAADEHLQSLIAQSVRGANISEKTMRNARIDAATAADTKDIVLAQIAEAEAVLNSAQAEYEAAKRANALEVVKRCHRDIITAADEKARAGAVYAEADARWQAAYEALFPAMREAGIAPQQHELDAYVKRKLMTHVSVPARIQESIIQRGAVDWVDLSRYERGLRLSVAAPDPEADEAPARAAREEAERIGRQQALDKAGRKQNERAPGFAYDWRPTDRLNHDDKLLSSAIRR